MEILCPWDTEVYIIQLAKILKYIMIILSSIPKNNIPNHSPLGFLMAEFFFVLPVGLIICLKNKQNPTEKIQKLLRFVLWLWVFWWKLRKVNLWASLFLVCGKVGAGKLELPSLPCGPEGEADNTSASAHLPIRPCLVRLPFRLALKLQRLCLTNYQHLGNTIPQRNLSPLVVQS